MSLIDFEKCSNEELQTIHTQIQRILSERHEKRKDELLEKVKVALDNFYKEYNAYDICISVDGEEIAIRRSDIYVV